MISKEAAKKEVQRVKKESIIQENLDKSITQRDLIKREVSVISSFATEDISELTKSSPTKEPSSNVAHKILPDKDQSNAE